MAFLFYFDLRSQWAAGDFTDASFDKAAPPPEPFLHKHRDRKCSQTYQNPKPQTLNT